MSWDPGLTDYDKTFYGEHLRDFLPSRIMDMHAHVWVGSTGAAPVRGAQWPARVAAENPIGDLTDTYGALFPDQQVTPLIFGFPDPLLPTGAQNAYVAEQSRKNGFPALALTQPEWDAGKFESVIQEGGFLGCKVYFNYAPDYIPEKEIRIYDYLPPRHLEVLDRRGWIAMLHIPRSGRLRDPVNLAQMLEIERNYPGLALIIAHVGRAYCPEDIGDAFAVLAETRNMKFDISANCNPWVFERLIRAVGADRILFGSDLPILRMRARRVCEGGTYVNIVPPGLYGDLSGDAHMREAAGGEADRITFLLYEGIHSFGCACRSAGLGRSDIEKIFFLNARNMIDKAGK